MTTNYEKCKNALSTIEKKYSSITKEFEEWYEDGGWDDEGLNDEFLEDYKESSFVDWIEEKGLIEEDKQGEEIWKILHDAITLAKTASIDSGSDDSKENTQLKPSQNNSNNQSSKPSAPDLNESIIVKLLSTEITAKEKKRNVMDNKSPLKKKIKSSARLMLPESSSMFGRSKTNNQAQDILHIELLGYKNNNYPLLLHFVDSVGRLQMNEWIKRGRKQDKKISTAEFFDKYCQHPEFKQFLKNANAEYIMPLIQSAIESYQGRIIPPFQFMEPIYKINGNPLDLCNYMFEMARIARNAANQPVHNLTSIIPLQIEFLVLNAKIKNVRPKANECVGVADLFDEPDEIDDYGDDDEDDDDEKELIPKDMDGLLKKNKIEYQVYNDPLREMLRSVEYIKRAVENKRCRRTVFVLDRRNNDNKDNDTGGTKGDKLYLFKPPKYDKFEENEKEIIHASLHHNSIISMLPRPEKKRQDFTARESLRGQMFVISFHIISEVEIRCYIFYQGQCFRFYGEDLINVLPIFFVETDKVKKLLITKLAEPKWRKAFDEFCNTFVDQRFEKFYHGLTGQSPRIKVYQ